MKKLAITCVALASSASLYAAPNKPDNNGRQPGVEKSNAGQDKKEGDRSQGDEHANWKAIANVCGKDNPAATHSALCVPKPASPD